MQHPPDGLIVRLDRARRNVEAGGVENTAEAVDVTAPVCPRAVRTVADDAPFRHSPASLGTLRDRIAIAGNQVPQRRGGECSRKNTAPPDNGDRLETHSPGAAYISTSLMVAMTAPDDEVNSTSQTILLLPTALPATRQRTWPCALSMNSARIWPMRAGRVGFPSEWKPHSRASCRPPSSMAASERRWPLRH